MQKPESLETPVEPYEAPPQVLFLPPTPTWWRIAILAAIFLVGIGAYLLRDTIGVRGQAAFDREMREEARQPRKR